MRKKIIISGTVIAVLFALITAIVFLYISNIQKELIEYKSSEKWGAPGYSHISAYMNDDAGFNANTMAQATAELEKTYIEDSIETPYALYSASAETTVSLSAQNSQRTSSAAATLYLGDYFRFHPFKLVEGAYPEATVNTDAILIDELAAWQLFGTKKGVVGLQVMIGNDIYVVCGVAQVPAGVYKKVYSESPRVYINADSAHYRSTSANRTFTSFEAMIPDPIENFAVNTVKEVLSQYNPVIHNIDKRFELKSLKEVYDKQISLIIDSKQTTYPYTEKAMLILTYKAADAYALLRAVALLSLSGVLIIFCAVYGPTVRFVEKLLKKLRF